MNWIIIANWKMQKSYLQAVKWVESYCDALSKFVEDKEMEFVLCPSFESIDAIGNLIRESNIKLGAQNCASSEFGAFTGEVSAVSLRELGCSYCIVGHSESRVNFCQTDRDIVEKVGLLLKHNIEPIFCIGETLQEKEAGLTIDVIRNQLIRLLELMNNFLQPKVVIAYEPVWSIGTGLLPKNNELNKVFDFLSSYLSQKNINLNFKLTYGGSVNPENINYLKEVVNLQGFLLGSSSLDFALLESLLKELVKT